MPTVGTFNTVLWCGSNQRGLFSRAPLVDEPSNCSSGVEALLVERRLTHGVQAAGLSLFTGYFYQVPSFV